MKKLFLFLVSLMLGISQLMADEVTFSASDLYNALPAATGQRTAVLPYPWNGAPSPVTLTLGEEGTVGATNIYFQLGSSQTLTVAATNGATLSSVTIATSVSSHVNNLSANMGTYASGSWTADGTTSEVVFTASSTCRVKSVTVVYTPKGNVGEDPVTVWTQELTVGLG